MNNMGIEVKNNNRLKIFCLGNIENNYMDEAQKNITKRLSSELSKIHNVRYDNAKRNIYSRGISSILGCC